MMSYVELFELLLQHRGRGRGISEPVHQRREVIDDGARHVVRIDEVVAFAVLHLGHEIVAASGISMNVEVTLREAEMEEPVADAISELRDLRNRLIRAG